MSSFATSRVFCAAGAAGFLLAACETQTSATRAGPGGETQVQIVDGLNCFDSKCFRYSAMDGTVAGISRYPTTPPPGVPLSSGWISASEFAATFARASTAPNVRGSGSDR